MLLSVMRPTGGDTFTPHLQRAHLLRVSRLVRACDGDRGAPGIAGRSGHLGRGRGADAARLSRYQPGRLDPTSDRPECGTLPATAMPRHHHSPVSAASLPQLSVADAEGTEGTDAAIDFTVRLSAAQTGTVTIDYNTQDDTATGRKRLHRDERHAHLQLGRDGEDRLCPDHRRYRCGRRRDVHPGTHEPGRRNPGRRNGNRHHPQHPRKKSRRRRRTPSPRVSPRVHTRRGFTRAQATGRRWWSRSAKRWSRSARTHSRCWLPEGRSASVQTHTEDGLSNAWIFFVTPEGDGDVTFTLAAGAACAAGGICTAGGTTLTDVPATRTIPGPDPAGRRG